MIKASDLQESSTLVPEFAGKFPCPLCSTLNRPLASWCKCGQEISFLAHMKQKERALVIPSRQPEEQNIFSREKILWHEPCEIQHPLPIPPIVCYGQIFIVCRHGELTCLEQESGKMVNTHTFPGDINSIPVLREEKKASTVEKHLIIGTTTLTCDINLISQEKKIVNPEIGDNFKMMHRPVCINDSVYRCAYNTQKNVSRLFHISMQTDTSDQIYELNGIVMQPIEVGDERVFVIGSEGGVIVQGKKVTNIYPKPEIGILYGGRSTPVWYGRFVYLFSTNGNLVKISLPNYNFTGVPGIKYEGTPGLFIDNDRIFLADNERLAIYDIYGKEEYEIQLTIGLQGLCRYGPGIFGKYAWACTTIGTLCLVDYHNRKECIRATIGNLYTQPTFCNNYVYALLGQDRSAKLVVFSLC